MASRMENLANLFSDVKTRTIIVFTGIILLTVIMVGLLGLSRSPNKESSATSSIPSAPKVTSTPGIIETTPEVAKVQEELNKQRYEQALKTGKSTIPVDVTTSQTSSASQSGGFIFGRNKPEEQKKEPLPLPPSNNEDLALQKQFQTSQQQNQQLPSFFAALVLFPHPFLVQLELSRIRLVAQPI